jgi:protein SCO1
VNRRQFHKSIAVATLLQSAEVYSHDKSGWVVPALPAPLMDLVDHNGKRRVMRTWLEHRLTFVQTMFTGCSSICPVQGAIFAELNVAIRNRPANHPLSLLSVSVDALGDSPSSLAEWLRRLGASGDSWSAAVPSIKGVDQLQRMLEGRASGNRTTIASHSSKVYIFDSFGLLRWRSQELPSVKLLLSVADVIVEQSSILRKS